MRKMRSIEDSEHIVSVFEHFITKNFWEYYVLDNKRDEDIRLCLVMGFEQEIGDVSMSEVKPYVVNKTRRLDNLLPAHGYEWVDD